MAPRNILKFTVVLTLFVVLAFAAPQLSAQWPQSFSTLNTLPAGWQLSTGGTTTGSNLWNVDANGTYRPLQTSTTFTPYVSAPYSLNWNDGVDANPGVSTYWYPYVERGVLTPTIDLTFAPNPVLTFMQLRDYYINSTGYHQMLVRVWDTTYTTMHYSETMGTGSTLIPWAQKNIPLNRNWGQVRIEFFYKSGYYYYEQYAAGWFIDDVNITGLTPPTLGIVNPNNLGTHAAGSPINIALTAQNGTAPYHSWQVVNSVLPPGMTISSTTGALGGTPTDAGGYGFTVQVRDTSNPQLIAQKTFSITITRPASFVYPVMNIPYTEDFSTDTGWVYSTNNVTYGPSPGAYSDTSAGGWERGYATQSSPASAYDYGDPGTDHTGTTDNMLLGVNVGGPLPTNLTLNTWYWAYSPQINLSGYRTVEIKFWKWLNAYYYYYHPCEVEIWNPFTNTWVDLWVMQYGDDRDNTWKQIAVDYDFGQTPTTQTTRIRFGFAITNTYATTTYHSGGWNVDDLQVIEKPSPGLLQITQLEIYSTQYVGSTPKVYVGQQYPVILRVQNLTTNPIEVHSFSYQIHLGGTPQNVGTLQPATTPSVANPWVIPASSQVYISNTSGTQISHIDFDCTALAPSGNGTSVILHVEMLGKEIGGANRATISNSQTDPSSDEVFTVFQLPPLTLTDPATLPNATVNVPYQFTFTAQYGTPPYVNWAKTAGPAWMTLTNNTLTFTATPVEVPNPPQTFQLTVYVEDSATPTAANTSKVFSVTVGNSTGPVPLQIVTGSQLPNATELQAYSPVQFNATGGISPYTWSNFQWLAPPAGNGSLTGMSFNTSNGQFGGTPAAGTVGGYAFNVTLTDSNTPTANSVTRTFYVSVLPEDPNVGITTPNTQGATGAPPTGLETSPYNGGVPFQFQATGGFTGPPSAEYHWAITSGQLPPGLVLDPESGELTGTPTTAGNYQFTLRASDGAFPPESGSQDFTIQIDPLIPQPLQIMTSSNLPQGFEGNPYQVLMEANFGKTPYTWRVKAGSTAPAGLGVNSTTGEFGGVIVTGQAAAPDQDFTFTIEVEDSSTVPEVAEKTFTMNIVAFIAGPLNITTNADLPQGGILSPYSTTIRATGGNPINPVEPYQFALASGSSLPLGLTLRLDGLIDGTPLQSQAGIHTFTIEANDGAGGSDSQTFTLQINGGAGGTDDSVEITPGKRKSELVPFWEACSAGPGSGGTALLLMLVLAGGAMYFRRRRA